MHRKNHSRQSSVLSVVSGIHGDRSWKVFPVKKGKLWCQNMELLCSELYTVFPSHPVENPDSFQPYTIWPAPRDMTSSLTTILSYYRPAPAVFLSLMLADYSRCTLTVGPLHLLEMMTHFLTSFKTSQKCHRLWQVDLTTPFPVVLSPLFCLISFHNSHLFLKHYVICKIMGSLWLEWAGLFICFVVVSQLRGMECWHRVSK